MSKVNVYLVRIPQRMDMLRAYKVFLDGVVTGEIRRDETLKLNVDPGEHRLSLRIDWVGSNTLLVNTRVGEDVYLQCGNNTETKSFWEKLAAATVDRNSYLYVKRA